MKRFLATCVFFLLIATSAFAGTMVSLKGQLTATIDGKVVDIQGTGEVELPEPYSLETQDDSPEVLAQIIQGDPNSEKVHMTVKTSKPFTVSGSKVNGVFEIKNVKNEFGNMMDCLVPVDEKAGEEGPWTVPAKKGDYYIGVEPDGESESEDDEIVEAAVLSFFKMTVE